MNTKTIEINNLEELTAFVMNNLRNADRKWMLECRASMEWVDEEAGKAWDAERDNLGYVSMFDEDKKKYEEYISKRTELDARKPQQKNVIDWSLRESGDGWHHTISLSEDLGKTLSHIWKTAPAYRGATTMKLVGYLTIPGMLKRLGQTDISGKVKEAQQKAKETADRNLRNYERHEVLKELSIISAIMEKHPEIFNQHKSLAVSNLARDISETIEK